jgi:hypothetical protein
MRQCAWARIFPRAGRQNSIQQILEHQTICSIVDREYPPVASIIGRIGVKRA